SPFRPQVLEEIVAAAPSVLLFDSISLTLSGLGLIPEVHRALPEVKVVMIGMAPDRETFLRSVREGATGYVLESASAMEIVLAIRSVANDEAVCPPCLCLALFEHVARQSNQMPSFHLKQQLGLTRREQQLVGMIGRNLTNKEIAAELN